MHWTEAESKWISLAEELRAELDASQVLAEKQRQELETEKRCGQELKEAMQMAMEGHARMLEQYADLEEKHMQLLARHRQIQEGIEDVKKAATRAGVRGAESKFIDALAAEISALKVEREKEKRYLRDENRALQSQLRDTAEAVQAAGELLVRLKEAEDAVVVAQVTSNHLCFFSTLIATEITLFCIRMQIIGCGSLCFQTLLKPLDAIFICFPVNNFADMFSSYFLF